jgi:hypothetical protein
VRLTEEQTYFAMRQMRRWIELRLRHEQRVTTSGYDRAFNQLIPDIDHSALLFRLLRGREPLPEPPQTEYSYPVYPDWPYIDDVEPSRHSSHKEDA